MCYLIINKNVIKPDCHANALFRIQKETKREISFQILTEMNINQYTYVHIAHKSTVRVSHLHFAVELLCAVGKDINEN